MDAMISSFSGGAVLTSQSASGSFTSASVVGGGLFRGSLKFSAHLDTCSVSVRERALNLMAKVILYARAVEDFRLSPKTQTDRGPTLGS